MWIFLEDHEWYPVPTPERTRRRDIGADVPKDLVRAWRKARRDFWKATDDLRAAYYSADQEPAE